MQGKVVSDSEVYVFYHVHAKWPRLLTQLLSTRDQKILVVRIEFILLDCSSLSLRLIFMQKTLRKTLTPFLCLQGPR